MSDTIAWKEKAAALRAAAERTADLVTQESLLLLAEDCDAFAEKEDETRREDMLAGSRSEACARLARNRG
jgi:hypothetical protein